MTTITINQNDAGQRLDKFLLKAFPLLPPALAYKYIRLKRIKVNGKRSSQEVKLSPGDFIELYIPDEFTQAVTNRSFQSLTPKLDIVYEDEHILLIDKKPGLIVHSDQNEELNTLDNHIKSYLWRRGEYSPDAESSFAPALCNRIDRNTGGLVIAAKDAATLRVMNEKIRLREVRKFYLCIVHGKMGQKSGVLEGFLTKDAARNQVEVTSAPISGDSRTIRTQYQVLREKGGLSLLEVELLTGRTHQIRAHFASVGHPLLGDGKYGVNKSDRAAGYRHQALYSYALTFDFKGEPTHLEYLNGQSFSVERVDFAEKF